MNAKTPVKSRVFRPHQSHHFLFPLNSADRLGSQIQQHTVDTGNLVGDAVGNVVQDGVRNLLDGSGHSILGVDSADDCGPAFVAALVFNANALDVGHGDEILPYLFAQTVLVELFAQDSVSFAQSFQTVAGDSTQAANAQTGAGKG